MPPRSVENNETRWRNRQKSHTLPTVTELCKQQAEDMLLSLKPSDPAVRAFHELAAERQRLREESNALAEAAFAGEEFTPMVPRIDSDDLMDLKTLAEYLGVTYGTIRTYRTSEVLPEPTMTVGNKPLWTKEKIDKWLREERHGS